MNRAGAVSIPELLLVTVLFTVVLGGIARFARDHNRLGALQRDRIRFEEAVRTTTVVLGAELRFLTAADIAAAGTDSVRLRAFRGGGPVCGGDLSAPLVLYRGLRQPDPDRDSVLVLGAGSEQVLSLTRARQVADCGGAMHLTLAEEAPEPPSYVLIFETGAYHLSDGAFRYRRGAGGRQPLTEPVLHGPAVEVVPSGLRVRLGPHRDSLPRLPAESRSIAVSALNRVIAP